MDYLLEISKNRRYILANSDRRPPNVAYEKFCAVRRMVKEGKIKTDFGQINA